MMRSLRSQAILTGVFITVVSITIGGISLYVSFDSIIRRKFDASLLNRQIQVLTAMDRGGLDESELSVYLPDPAYSRPYSGIYWEVVGPSGQLITSRSLLDGIIDRPEDVPGETIFYQRSISGEQVRVAARTVTLTNGERWQVVVARSITDLRSERLGFRRSILLALGAVGLIGITGSLGQTASLLRQLTALRSEVLNRWRGEGDLEVNRYPAEVRPLVVEINELLHRNRDIIDRTRRQGADLAHALKTPCAILRNELDAIRRQGTDVSVAISALDRIDGQVRRALARVRAVRPVKPGGPRTSLALSLQRLVRLFRSLPAAGPIVFEIDVPSELFVAIDQQDLEEVLGNLLDNAIKWANSRIRISAREVGSSTEIEIEDDGPGVPDADIPRILRAGGRLDTSVDGSGLGLAIANDLVEIYGGRLLLSQSPLLGGLRVALIL